MEEVKRKRGETEAMYILEKMAGLSFDHNYCDDGSEYCKPDLKCLNGRYVEVTHTRHNDAAVMFPNEFQKKSEAEQKRIIKTVRDAWRRKTNNSYEMDEFGRMTPKGKAKRDRDKRTLKRYYGFNPANGLFDRDGTDIASITMSLKTIAREIEQDKGPKYIGTKTDLFIFVLKEEFDLIMDPANNEDVQYLLRAIGRSPFKTVFICEWDWKHQTYNLLNPRLMITHNYQTITFYNTWKEEEMKLN